MPRIDRMPPLGGVYNVTPEEYWIGYPEEERPEGENGYDFVWSVAELPPAGSQEQERQALAKALHAAIVAALDDAGHPPYNDVLRPVFGRYAIGTYPDDREMRFFLEDPAAITPELIRRLQDLLRREFPLWRVVPQYEEQATGVYPDGVRIGGALISGDLPDGHPSFTAWSDQAQALHEAKYGPLRRQLAWLAGRLPGVLEAATRDGFAPMGAFHRSRGSGPGGADEPPILWLLEPTATADAFTLNVTANGAELGRLEDYGVDAEGRLLPGPPGDTEAPFRLRGYVPATAAERFELKLKRGHWPVVARGSIERVIRDDELREQGFE